MDALVAGAEAFIQVFRTAADVFVGFTTGIIPIVVVFLTAVNAVVNFIGKEKVEGFAKWASQPGIAFMPIRYTSTFCSSLYVDKPSLLYIWKYKY